MGGRAVEGSGLENRQGCKLLVGSNPTPSAKITSVRPGDMGDNLGPKMRSGLYGAPLAKHGRCSPISTRLSEMPPETDVSAQSAEGIERRIVGPGDVGRNGSLRGQYWTAEKPASC